MDFIIRCFPYMPRIGDELPYKIYQFFALWAANVEANDIMNGTV